MAPEVTFAVRNTGVQRTVNLHLRASQRHAPRRPPSTSVATHARTGVAMRFARFKGLRHGASLGV
eukprot:1109080-Rhodomonas_salina.1